MDCIGRYIKNRYLAITKYIKKQYPAIVLLIALTICITLIVCSLYHYLYPSPNWFLVLIHLSNGQILTYGIGLLAAFIVFTQIRTLQKQLQVNALMDYSKQWNSAEMRSRRKAAMDIIAADKLSLETRNLDLLEQVLEPLEDFSTLAADGVLSKDLIWHSSLGWYASRYFIYSFDNGTIDAIRSKWAIAPNEPDDSYYEQLQCLYNQYLKKETKRRNSKYAKICKITTNDVEKGYLSDKEKFIFSEDPDRYHNTKAFKKVIIELRPSTKIDGVGVFAVDDINEGDFIAEGIHTSDYDDLLTWESIESLDNDIKDKIHAFCIGTPEGFIPPKDFDFNKLSVEWYMNHSCDGIVGFNENGDFYAIKNIKKGDELTYDYGLAESNPTFTLEPCKCGSPNCRGKVTGNDWKDPGFRNKNRNHMLPKLRVME
ncbi:MAG: SET domain-containing protein-lysine N-methyltransferase [Syntrophobacteraceae bacterium]|jgi:hypothetical protein